MLIGPVVHYRSSEIIVTDEYVELRGVRLAVRDLHGVVRYTRRHPRRKTIEALYRGDRVTLYSTRDETEFGRVRRALIRAIERDRDRHRR